MMWFFSGAFLSQTTAPGTRRCQALFPLQAGEFSKVHLGCRGEAYTIAEDAGSNKLTIVPALGPQPLRNRKRGDLRGIFTVMKRSNADPDRIRLLDDAVKRSTAVHIGNPGELILTDKRLDSVQNAAFCRNLGCRFGGMQNKTVLIEKLRSQCIWILQNRMGIPAEKLKGRVKQDLFFQTVKSQKLLTFSFWDSGYTMKPISACPASSSRMTSCPASSR